MTVPGGFAHPVGSVRAMGSERGTDEHLDYDAVRAYWEDAADEADSASYMAHDQGLPRDCIEHRFALEQGVIDRWFAALGPTAAVLDIGCGAGAWTALFAQRYGRVVGVDASAGMLAARRAGAWPGSTTSNSSTEMPSPRRFRATSTACWSGGCSCISIGPTPARSSDASVDWRRAAGSFFASPECGPGWR